MGFLYFVIENGDCQIILLVFFTSPYCDRLGKTHTSEIMIFNSSAENGPRRISQNIQHLDIDRYTAPCRLDFHGKISAHLHPIGSSTVLVDIELNYNYIIYYYPTISNHLYS